MTTICYDGKMLASDSQISRGLTKWPGAFPKIYYPDPEKEYWEVNGVKALAFAVSGDATAVDYIREALAKGINFRTRVEHEDLDFETIIVDENGTSYMWTVFANKDKRGEQHHLLPMVPPIAGGSGGRFALAVMIVKKSAEEAVKAAMKIDMGSGGEVQVFHVPPKPEVPSVRPAHLKPSTEAPVHPVNPPPVQQKTETLETFQPDVPQQPANEPVPVEPAPTVEETK